MNQRKIGTILSYIATVLHILVSLLYVPLLLKGIGQNEYGLYQLVGSVIAYVSIAESLLSAGVLRYYCKYKSLSDEKMMENTLAISKYIYYIFSLAIILIGFILIYTFNEIYNTSLSEQELFETKIMIAVLIVNIIINLTNYVYSAAITANEKFIFLKCATILTTCMQPLCVLLFIGRFPYALTVVVAQSAINVVLALIKRFYCIGILKVKIKYHGKDTELIKNIILFSGGVFFAALADQIFWKADQLILGKMYGTSIVAVYAIGAQIYNNYSAVGTGVNSVFMPRISVLYNKKHAMDAISDLFIKVGRFVFILAMLVLTEFALFGREFISIWAGEKYLVAYYVALIIMIPFTIDIIQSLGLTILQVENKYTFRGKMYLIIAIINIFSTIIMAKIWGMIGASLSTAISMLIGNGFIMNWYYCKKVNLNIKKFWIEIAKVLPAVTLSVCLGLLITKLKMSNAILQLLFHLILYIIIYTIVMYIVGLNEYEKKTVKNILNKNMDRR